MGQAPKDNGNLSIQYLANPQAHRWTPALSLRLRIQIQNISLSGDEGVAKQKQRTEHPDQWADLATLASA